MKSHISIASILGAAGVNAVPDQGLIELNTFCVTYLSTYLVPVSQNASSTNDHSTLEPPFLTTVDGTTFTLTDQPGLTSNPIDSLTSLTSEEISSSALAPFVSESSSIQIDPTEALTSGKQVGTSIDETSLFTTIDLGTTTITSVVPTSSSIIEPQGQAVILAVSFENDNQKRSMHKRTLGGFVGQNDPNICTFASTFNFAEDQLFVGGLPIFYSPGDTNKELIGGDNLPEDAVTRGFTIAGGTLGFRNANLPSGAASFCQTEDGRVFIVFTDGPPECVPVVLLVYSVLRCQNGQIVGLETTTPGTVTSQTVGTDSATIIGSTQSADFTASGASPQSSGQFQSQTTDSKASTAASSNVKESTASLKSTTAEVPISEFSTTESLTASGTPDTSSTEAVESTAAASETTSQPRLDSSQLPETVVSTGTETTTSDALKSTIESTIDTETPTVDETTTDATVAESTTAETTTAVDTTTTKATTAEDTTAEPTSTDITTGETTPRDTTTAAYTTTSALEDTTTNPKDTTTAAEDTTTTKAPGAQNTTTTTEAPVVQDTTTTGAPVIPGTTTTEAPVAQGTTTTQAVIT
ncbi:hypothetical protein DER45DRAFT_596186 [Fusarium avenaceum]|nr:hypothetical protein DER45DRAFT_596186 [Fusarium avenaceum]